MKMFGGIFTVGGIGVAIYGFTESQSFSNQFMEAFGGKNSGAPIMYFGIGLAVVGVVCLVLSNVGTKKKIEK